MSITWDKLQAAFKSAAKGSAQPNYVLLKARQMGKSSFTGGPFSTMTAAQIQMKNLKYPTSNIDVVIRREVIPTLLDDIHEADEFDSWTWHGFNNTPTNKAFVGLLSARRISDGQHFLQEIKLLKDVVIDTKDLNHLFTIIDAEFDYAMKVITAMANPHDVNTCTDPECPC